MSFSNIFIFRPIMRILLMVAFVFAGYLGYYILPINSLPRIDFPTIQATVLFLGTSAKTMVRTVTLPLDHRVSFNLRPDMMLGEAVSKIDLKIPQSIAGSFQGKTQVFKAMRTQAIWLILWMLCESYIHPLTTLPSLPTADIGALLELILTGMNLYVISLIGLIMLFGIVKKNAIMMIDYALVQERQHGKLPQEDIFEAALRRSRPIMITTFSAIMGILLITFGLGAGAELCQLLGGAVVVGLIASQALTLYITPVIYIYLDKLSKRVKKVALLRAIS